VGGWSRHLSLGGVRMSVLELALFIIGIGIGITLGCLAVDRVYRRWLNKEWKENPRG
jgi:hypothetical protein